MKIVFLPYGEGNPYPDLLSRSLEKCGVTVVRPRVNTFFATKCFFYWKPDVVHLHWLHVFFLCPNIIKAFIKMVVFISQIGLLKISGIRIVWTVHNLRNHKNQHIVIDKVCSKVIAALSDAIIAHCRFAKKAVIKEFSVSNSEKIHIIPHGHFADFYQNGISCENARKKTGIDKDQTVFLFFGAIEPYKGILDLLEAFKSRKQNDETLLMVGKASDNKFAETIMTSIADSTNIVFIPEFVSDNEIQIYMNACDVVVFPFKDIFTSGSVIMAMSFGKPCIVPALGCIPELLNDSGGFLYNPGDREGLRQAMNQAKAKKPLLKTMGAYNKKSVLRLSWEEISKKTMKAYSP